MSCVVLGVEQTPTPDRVADLVRNAAGLVCPDPMSPPAAPSESAIADGPVASAPARTGDPAAPPVQRVQAGADPGVRTNIGSDPPGDEVVSQQPAVQAPPATRGTGAGDATTGLVLVVLVVLLGLWRLVSRRARPSRTAAPGRPGGMDPEAIAAARRISQRLHDS